MTETEAKQDTLTSEKPIVFKKRGPRANIRKRPATPEPASDESEYSSEDEQGQRIKRRRKRGTVNVSSKSARIDVTDLETTKFSADRSTTIENSGDATKQSSWHDQRTDVGLDTKNLLGSTRQKPSESTATASDGTYKGANNYSNFLKKNPNAPDRKFGPIKAPTNIRTITTIDYAPDVCKDYKVTGFCGFGDSCKFSHIREDYKQGWALDREWEVQTKGKKLEGITVASVNREDLAKDEENAEEAAILEKIPFACIICRKSYTQPVVTKCGHYFCEKCALQRYRKNPNCAACGAGTNGVFNTAKTLNKLLERKKAREERLKEKREEEDE
jgi:RING finger protein 113A